jgi:hypothetical protein
LWLALSGVMAEHGDDRRAAWSLLHHPLWPRHRPEAPDDVAAPFQLPMIGLPGCTTAVGEPSMDQLKAFAALVFDGDQEVCIALGKIEKKGRGVQRVGLHLHTLKVDCLQQLAQGLDLSAGIGGVGGLGDRHAQHLGVEAHLGD